MFNINSSENPKNGANNQSSSINPQFINRKREKMFEIKNKNKRDDNGRREYFWTVFSFLMVYISKEFGLEFNLNYQTQFEAIYGCTIKIMRKVLSFKIYQIISLFKNTQLTEKGKPIKDAYTKLKKNSTLHETFVFLMECTYDQLLEYYFDNNTEPKKNVKISSLMDLIKKDKIEIKNAIEEIKTKKGRKERKRIPLVLDELMSSFRNFEQKFLEKDDKDNIFNNSIANRLTDCTSQNEIQYINLVNNNNSLYATDEFNLFENQDMEVSKPNENMNSVFSLNQNNDSLDDFLNINSNNFPSPTPHYLYNFENNDI